MKTTDPDYILPVTKNDIVGALEQAIELVEQDYNDKALEVLLELLDDLSMGK
jgi:hypothetical protein